MQAGTIGEWTPDQLSAFIRDQFVSNIQTAGTSYTCDTLVVKALATIEDQLKFMQSVQTVGGAGGASALPATPAGYIPILDLGGNLKVIPYYNS